MLFRCARLAAALLLAFLSLALFRTGVRAQDTIDDKRTVLLQGASAVQADLTMRFGRLVVNPVTSARATPAATPVAGSDLLLAARFRYSNKDWRPEVDYSVSGATGTLKLSQSDASDVDIGDLGDVTEGESGNRWDLGFNREVPLDLEIDATAGDVQVNAGGLTLDRLDIDVEAGRVELDLTGEWDQAPEKIKVETTSGQIVLRIPRDVGVRVDADTGFAGEINADDGLQRVDGDYVNAAYGRSSITIPVEADATVGEIRIELADK